MQRMSVVARVCVAVLTVAAFAGVLGASAAFAKDNTGFGFNAGDIRGGTAGAVSLTGGGAFDASTGFGHPGGGFRCTEAVGQGPLTGCQAGQGVRWDTDSVLASTVFKCTSSPAGRRRPRRPARTRSPFTPTSTGPVTARTSRSRPTCSCRRATLCRTSPGCRTCGCRESGAASPAPTSAPDPRRRLRRSRPYRSLLTHVLRG